MKLVVGLGNPGREYAQSRHNVGWMALDRLAERAGWNVRVKGRDAAASVRGRYHDLDLLLVKPLTYMNDSGVAVRKVLARERAPLEELLVVVDDFALPFGRLRLRGSGSAGGHNGLRSIIGELQTEQFARLRVGIGEPRRGAVDHVLSRFLPEERDLLPAVLDAVVDTIEAWATDGVEAASSRWNGWQLDVPEQGDGAPSRRPAGLRLEAGDVTAGRGGARRKAGIRPAVGSGSHGGGPGGSAVGHGGPPEAGTDVDASDHARSTTEQDADGGTIVRTRTGWRKLLPGLGGGDAPERRR